MFDFTPRHLAAITLTMLTMAADTLTSAPAPRDTFRVGGLESVGAYASSLAPGQTAIHAVPFDKGREYHLTATCGDGCDVALRLFAPSGSELDRHVAARKPEVAVVPAASGLYRVDVAMTACPAALCAYTVTVLAR